MLRTIDVNLKIEVGQLKYEFPSNSLGLQSTDVVKGIGIRSNGKAKNGNTLVSAANIQQGFLNLKESGGRDLHQSLSLDYVLQLTQSDRFQMLPIPSGAMIYWEESSVTFLAGAEVANTTLELIIYYESSTDKNC